MLWPKVVGNSDYSICTGCWRNIGVVMLKNCIHIEAKKGI